MAYTYPVTSVPASAGPTPWQTVGPFFHDALPYAAGSSVVGTSRPGAVTLHGHVYDGAGEPVPDAMLEISQAGPDGTPVRVGGSLRRDGWTFTGWGRAETDALGHYSFATLIPGPADAGTDVTG